MAKLHFKKLGSGEPLIILHGLYGSSDNWITIARELMDTFTVYLVDLRNHGASPHLPEHNYSVMVDDLAEFMNDAEIYSANILGHSMGGKLAMYFTATYPERVKKLIVVDISVRTYTFEKCDKQVSEHDEILKGLRSINLTSLHNRDDADSQLAQVVGELRIRQFLLKNLKRSKEGKFEWKINIDALQQNLPSILVGLENEASELRLYKGKVLFLRGGQSKYIKTDDELLIHSYFAYAQIITISNASHWVHADEPELFIEYVRKFIAN